MGIVVPLMKTLEKLYHGYAFLLEGMAEMSRYLRKISLKSSFLSFFRTLGSTKRLIYRRAIRPTVY